jgi:3-oxoacyl-[acyl-carrier protein] reductase
MIIVVTGASRGIGRAVALAFGAPVHRVLIGYEKSREQAESAAAAVRLKGGEAAVFHADVSQRDQARALVDQAVLLWGRLDVLVNNAGVTRDRTILKMSEDEWRRVVDVNLSGAFWVLQAAAKVMSAAKSGCILNVASIMALRGGYGCANYSAAKAGLVALTKSAARELGRFNVRVNAFLPGFHATDMNQAFGPEQLSALKTEHTLGRLPDLEELARFVVHLASLQSVSGQVFAFESRVL